MNNHAGSCNFTTEDWVHRAMEERDKTSRSYILAQKLITYDDTESTPYIYLLDGGIADNLGLRSSLEFIQGRGLSSTGSHTVSPR